MNLKIGGSSFKWTYQGKNPNRKALCFDGENFENPWFARFSLIFQWDKVHSGKLTWKISSFNRSWIYKLIIFHSYVRLPVVPSKDLWRANHYPKPWVSCGFSLNQVGDISQYWVCWLNLYLVHLIWTNSACQSPICVKQFCSLEKIQSVTEEFRLFSRMAPKRESVLRSIPSGKLT